MTTPESGGVQVLHIGPDVNGPGGIPAVIRTLLASPLGERHELSFESTYGSAKPWRRLVTFARGLRAVRAWCRGPGDRLVHVHAATRGSWYRKAIAVALVKRNDRPVVLHFHAGAGDIRNFEARLGPVRHRLIRAAFRQADAVIAVSAASAAEVQRIFAFTAVDVVPNAAPDVDTDATGLPADSEPPTIVYLGGFANPAKGSDVLLDALAELLAADTDVRVVLAGPGDPPATAAALLESPRVRWEAYLREVPKAAVMREAQMFVMPSISEGMPIALLEAMAYGLAIVATTVGGIPEVAEHGENAILVEPGDRVGLALALGELIADPELRGRLGRAARERAERLNCFEVFGHMAGVYDGVCGRRSDAVRAAAS